MNFDTLQTLAIYYNEDALGNIFNALRRKCLYNHPLSCFNDDCINILLNLKGYD